MTDSQNPEAMDPASIELPRPMPNSLQFAIAAAVIGLGYMLAVFLGGLMGIALAVPAVLILLAGFLSAFVGLVDKHNRRPPYVWHFVGVFVILGGQIAFLIPGLGTIRLLNLHCRLRVAITGGQEELQSWAVEVLAQPRDPMHQDGSGWRIPHEECSKQIQRLKPKRISIEQLFENDQEGVSLMYGGGFLHWYIVLGSPGSVPDPKFEETLTENDG